MATKRTYKTLFLDGNLAKEGEQPATIIIGDDLIEHFGISQAAAGSVAKELTSAVDAFNRYRTITDAKTQTNPIRVTQHTRNFYSLPGSQGRRGGKLVVVDSGVSKGTDANGVPLGNFTVSFRSNANISAISVFISSWGLNTPTTFSVNGVTRPVLTEAEIKG